MRPIAPVILLHVITAKVENMFCKPYPIHLWVAGQSGFKALPPDEMEIFPPNYILSIKKF